MKHFKKLKEYWLLIAFIVFLFFLIFYTYRDYGIAWDEKVYLQVGRYYLLQVLNFFHVANNLSGLTIVPSDIHLKTHGVFFDVVVVFSSVFFRSFNFETYHLIKALFAIFIFILSAAITNKLLGKWYALASMIFLLLFPYFYGNMFINSIDIPTTLFFTLVIWYFFYFLQGNQSLIKQILFGFLMAILINQRMLFLYILLLNILTLFLVNSILKKQKFIFTIGKIILITASTLVFMHLTHPYLFTHPITGIYDIFITSEKGFPFTSGVLFDGKFYFANNNPLPWYYLPKMILITVPLITLFLFVIGNLRIFYLIIKEWTVRKGSSTPVVENIVIKLYILLIFFIPLIVNFILKPTLYDSWRHFLFLTIPIVIIAMYGLAYLFGNWKLIGHWNLVIGILILIGLISTAKEMIILHPYEYVFYNSLVGGLKGAYGQYETDYWGLAYKEATLWFNNNIDDPKKQYKIFVEGDPLSSTTYFKNNMYQTYNREDYNYVFTFTRWNFHLQYLWLTIHTIDRDGIPLVFIKEAKKP